jgi:acyl-ACP thioesterase
MGPFVDLATGKVTKLPPEFIASLKTDRKQEMEYLPRKIDVPDVAPTGFPAFKIMNGYIDMYGHTNNIKYIMLAAETLRPADHRKIKRTRAEYKTPALYGDTMYTAVYAENNRRVIRFFDGDTVYALVEFTL